MTFSFIPDGHRYFLGNIEKPALSRILELIDNSSDFYTDEAAEKGTNIHKMIELHELDNLDESSLTDDMRNYLKQWENAKKWFGIKSFNLIEVPLYCCELGYGVTPDYFSYEKLLILDIKTGAINNKTWPIQLAGQETAIREKFNISKSKKIERYAVQLSQEKFNPIHFSDHKDFNILRAVVIAYKYKNGLL